jgi:hypothetical protein
VAEADGCVGCVVGEGRAEVGSFGGGHFGGGWVVVMCGGWGRGCGWKGAGRYCFWKGEDETIEGRVVCWWW